MRFDHKKEPTLRLPQARVGLDTSAAFPAI